MRAARARARTIWGQRSSLRPVMRTVTVAQPMGHTAYQHVGHTAYQHVGDDPPIVSITNDQGGSFTIEKLGEMSTREKIARTALTAAAAYHGYRRNGSVLWAVLWVIGANIAPVIAGAVAVAQGFGQSKRSS